VTSHQQETVSKNDSRFNHAIKQFFAQTAAHRPMVGGGGVRLTAACRLISVGSSGVRNSAARRYRRGAARTSKSEYPGTDIYSGTRVSEYPFRALNIMWRATATRATGRCATHYVLCCVGYLQQPSIAVTVLLIPLIKTSAIADPSRKITILSRQTVLYTVLYTVRCLCNVPYTVSCICTSFGNVSKFSMTCHSPTEL
jgi:hypothetical protein